jgi:hypothetical protein
MTCGIRQARFDVLMRPVRVILARSGRQKATSLTQ